MSLKENIRGIIGWRLSGCAEQMCRGNRPDVKSIIELMCKEIDIEIDRQHGNWDNAYEHASKSVDKMREDLIEANANFKKCQDALLDEREKNSSVRRDLEGYRDSNKAITKDRNDWKEAAEAYEEHLETLHIKWVEVKDKLNQSEENYDELHDDYRNLSNDYAEVEALLCGERDAHKKTKSELDLIKGMGELDIKDSDHMADGMTLTWYEDKATVPDSVWSNFMINQQFNPTVSGDRIQIEDLKKEVEHLKDEVEHLKKARDFNYDRYVKQHNKREELESTIQMCVQTLQDCN